MMKFDGLLKLAPALAAFGLVASTAHAQTAPKPLAPAAAAKALVDGRPWNWSVPDGKKGRMTFNVDGTGKLEGPVTMGIKWSVKGPDFCIAMGFMLGTKCVTVVPSTRGYQTFNKGVPAFLFTR